MAPLESLRSAPRMIFHLLSGMLVRTLQEPGWWSRLSRTLDAGHLHGRIAWPGFDCMAAAYADLVVYCKAVLCTSLAFGLQSPERVIDDPRGTTPVKAALLSQANLVSVEVIRRSRTNRYPPARTRRGCCKLLRIAWAGIQADICCLLAASGSVASLPRRLLVEGPFGWVCARHQALDFDGF